MRKEDWERWKRGRKGRKRVSFPPQLPRSINKKKSRIHRLFFFSPEPPISSYLVDSFGMYGTDRGEGGLQITGGKEEEGRWKITKKEGEIGAPYPAFPAGVKSLIHPTFFRLYRKTHSPPPP